MASPHVHRFLILTLSVVSLACGDYTRSTSPPTIAKALPSSFTVGASFAILANGTKGKAVKWAVARPRADATVSAVIGPEGGSLLMPGSDFSMTIPAGALASPITITVVAKGGQYVAYDMQPHGLKFLKPVTAVQGLRNTALFGTDAGNSVRGAYLPDGAEQIDIDDSASPAELEAATTLYSGTQPVAEKQFWILNHFSRYILISGVWTLVTD